MVLIGTSIHCLCLMICLQVGNQWQFLITFSLEDKGFRKGRNCYEVMREAKNVEVNEEDAEVDVQIRGDVDARTKGH